MIYKIKILDEYRAIFFRFCAVLKNLKALHFYAVHVAYGVFYAVHVDTSKLIAR